MQSLHISFVMACACLIAGATCLPCAGLSCMRGPAWDDLTVTWNPNPFASYGFNSMPLTISDAKAKGFTLREDSCANEGSPFRGLRYWKNGDAGLTLIYDARGNVVGIQTSVLKNFASWSPTQQNKGHPYVEDGDYWTLTVYLTNTDDICKASSTIDAPINSQKAFTHTFFIQNGSNPITDLIEIPTGESGLEPTKWTKGKCFWSMGLHYWYDIKKNMNCDSFFPFFLLYNSGALTGFGFAITDISQPLQSPRYEHPGQKEAKLFIDPFPDCVAAKTNKFSTLHVWMTSKPQFHSFC